MERTVPQAQPSEREQAVLEAPVAQAELEALITLLVLVRLVVMAAPPATVAPVQATVPATVPAAPVVPAVLVAMVLAEAYLEQRALLVHLPMTMPAISSILAIAVV